MHGVYSHLLKSIILNVHGLIFGNEIKEKKEKKEKVEEEEGGRGGHRWHRVN